MALRQLEEKWMLGDMGDVPVLLRAYAETSFKEYRETKKQFKVLQTQAPPLEPFEIRVPDVGFDIPHTVRKNNI